MKIVWRHDDPVTVRDVYEELRLERPIAYTTVMTNMKTLEQKGYLTATQQDRAHLYSPARPKQQVIGEMVRDFVNRVFNGSGRPLVAAPPRGRPSLGIGPPGHRSDDGEETMTNAIWIRDLGAFSVQVAALVFAGAAVAFLVPAATASRDAAFLEAPAFRLSRAAVLPAVACIWSAAEPSCDRPDGVSDAGRGHREGADADAVIEIVWRSADPSADRGGSRSGRLACHGRARDSTFAARRRTTGADAARNSRSAAPCRRTRRHPRVGSSDRADDVRSVPSGGSAACAMWARWRPTSRRRLPTTS